MNPQANLSNIQHEVEALWKATRDESDSEASGCFERLSSEGIKGELCRTLERDEELKKIANFIATKNVHPIVTGESGVGKTTILEELAIRAIMSEAPHTELNGRDFFFLRLDNLPFGRDTQEIQSLFLRALKYCHKNNAVLVFDNMDTFWCSPYYSKIGLLDIFIENLKKSDDFLFVGIALKENYLLFPQVYNGIMRKHFYEICIDEPSPDNAKTMIFREKRFIKASTEQDKVLVEKNIQEAVKLSTKYMTNERLPSKAVKILDYAIAANNQTVEEGIQEYISGHTTLPKEGILDGSFFEETKEKLGISIVGQKIALYGVQELIDDYANASTPTSSDLRRGMLLVGPQSSGKRTIVRAVARRFGGEAITFNLKDHNNNHRAPDVAKGILHSKLEGSKPPHVVLVEQIDEVSLPIQRIIHGILKKGKLDTPGKKDLTGLNVLFIMTSTNSEYVSHLIPQKDTYYNQFNVKETPNLITNDLYEFITNNSDYFHSELFAKIDCWPCFPLSIAQQQEVVRNRIEEIRTSSGEKWRKENHQELVFSLIPQVTPSTPEPLKMTTLNDPPQERSSSNRVHGEFKHNLTRLERSIDTEFNRFNSKNPNTSPENIRFVWTYGNGVKFHYFKDFSAIKNEDFKNMLKLEVLGKVVTALQNPPKDIKPKSLIALKGNTGNIKKAASGLANVIGGPCCELDLSFIKGRLQSTMEKYILKSPYSCFLFLNLDQAEMIDLSNLNSLITDCEEIKHSVFVLAEPEENGFLECLIKYTADKTISLS